MNEPLEAVRVHVVKYRDRDNLVMRYRCPLTGKQVSRSTGTSQRRVAEKLAAKWEAELQEGRYSRSRRMAWEEFRDLWEDARIATLKPSSVRNYAATMNAFESLCRPQRLFDLNTARVTAFAAGLRGKGLAETTVAQHLRHLKSVARWGNRQGLLTGVPVFDMPKRAAVAKMKGRPITGEEFDRLVAAVPAVVGEPAADSWQLLLRGLWWSGLRLGEALALRWDQQPGGVWVILDGRRSVLAFDAGAQKSGKVQLVPLAPEAVEMLAPIKRPQGYVFKPQRIRGSGAMARDKLKAGKIISDVGKTAGVLVEPATGKTATAHDLRRSFGYRWSRRVMPPDLKTLMRHASIETTLTYYVGQNATATAAVLWDAVGTNLGNSDPAATRDDSRGGQRTPSEQGV